MARTVNDAEVQSKSKRADLPAQRRPHWYTLRPGKLHLGYVKSSKSQSGFWTVRTYVGSARKPGKSPYRIKRLPGVADDFQKADGSTVLSFDQAQDLALAPPPMPQPGGPLTVAGAVASYVVSLRDQGRDRAAADTLGRLRMHLPPELAATPVATLTAEQLRKWLSETASAIRRRRSGEDAERRSKVSANRVLIQLRAALNHAFREELVPSNAAWQSGRVRPFGNVDVARKGFLSVEQSVRLINAAQGAFRHLVQAALHTGCRYGELCRLRVHDLHADGGTVFIQKTKTGKSRHVHLTDEGLAFFRQITAGRPGSEPMLRMDSGGTWHADDQRRPMIDAVTAARISPPISFHGLRHTYASLAIMGGVPLLVVAQNLGHSDTRMVERHYGHLATSHKQQMIRDHAPTFGSRPQGGRN
jgi:integrase